MRLEHWTNATEQPQAVARDIVAGTATAFRPVPYFWSDQYDAKLQCLGFTAAVDEAHVVAVAGELVGARARERHELARGRRRDLVQVAPEVVGADARRSPSAVSRRSGSRPGLGR